MIRDATADDAGWVAALWNDVIAHTQITFTTVLKTQDDIAQMLAERVVLVLDEQRGFATYGPFRHAPGYAATAEHSVFLAPKARGHGQGRALLAALERRAQAEGVHVLVAAISGTNPSAVAFHNRLGFDHVAHMPEVGFKDGQWLDLILMQKRLNTGAAIKV